MRKSETEEKYKELLKLHNGGIPLILEDFNLLNSYKKYELIAFLILYKRKCIELGDKLKELVEK